MKKKVAIQGIAGSYHDIAARNYHEGEEIEIIPCNTFRDVITTIKKDPSVLGMMAIENTIAGSLLQNHELIRESGLIQFLALTVQELYPCNTNYFSIFIFIRYNSVACEQDRELTCLKTYILWSIFSCLALWQASGRAWAVLLPSFENPADAPMAL